MVASEINEELKKLGLFIETSYGTVEPIELIKLPEIKGYSVDTMFSTISLSTPDIDIENIDTVYINGKEFIDRDVAGLDYE